MDDFDERRAAERRPAPRRRRDGRPLSTEHGRRQELTAFEQQRALTVNLMEQVCNPKNLLRAYRRVRSNNGKPGVDRMTVHHLADWLRENIAALTAALLDGTYRPRPVRGVSIPKPGGGQRQLGIPVVVDRLVQQAILRVLDPIFDPTFSNSSYVFRPGPAPTWRWNRPGSTSPRGARVCRGARPRKAFRPGKSRYPHVPDRAQDRRSENEGSSAIGCF
jgi:hypothetical protein